MEAYGSDLASFVALAGELGFDPETEMPADAVRTMVGRLHRRGLGGRSLQRWLAAVRAYYRYLIREDRCRNNPATGVRAPRFARKLPAALDPDEIKRLVEIPLDREIAVRDRAMLELFYSSGLRLSELVGLDWPDLRLEERRVRVLGKGAKTREVPVGRAAIEALEAWRTVQRLWCRDAATEAVFTARSGRRLGVRGVQARVEHWARTQGLWKRVHPHLLRHSFATHVLESSGQLRAVQEMLGHANLSTTQVYTHLDHQHLAEVYDRTHPRSRRKSED